MKEDEIKAAVASGLDDLLSIGDPLRGLVADYLGDAPARFSGRLFDRLPDNPPDRFTGDDLTALAALDVPAGRDAVEKLLGSGRDRFNQLLADVPTEIDLLDGTTDQEELHEALARAGDLRVALRDDINGIGWVKAHKLVARKRPLLHPVYDSVVERWFAPVDGIRYGLAGLVADGRDVAGELQGALDPDRATGLGPLRLLDIAVWMCGATQDAAVDARERHQADVPTERVFSRT